MSASSAEMTQRVAQRWFSALREGNGPAALGCLADDVLWINNPPEKGLSDIVPWLGEYHGARAVAGTFEVWGKLSQVQSFELRQLVIHEDEALALVHEVARVNATGLCYDIEFVQRLRVAEEKIVFWKSYWDTVKGIVPFRGDMQARLLAAARTNDVEEAMRVLPFGCGADVAEAATGQSALMLAAARGHLEMVRALLAAGADPNAVDPRAGATALHKACQGGHLKVVQVLVEAGAFIDQQAATTGHTPLIEAVWFASEEVVAYLLSRDARLEARTSYGFTLDDHLGYALRVTAGRNHAALLRIQDLIAQRRRGDEVRSAASPLLQAVLAGDLEATRQALAAGADVEQRYPVCGTLSDGHTPLLIAARDGRADIVRELLRAGANVNAVDPLFGAVPLHKATYHGYEEVTRLLAQCPHVDLNYQGPSNGYTPLHDALWHGYPECARLLLECGARLDIEAFDGKLPVDIAVEQFGPDHPVVAELRGRSLRDRT